MNEKYSNTMLLLKKYQCNLSRSLSLLLIFTCLFCTSNTQAHPHSWVDLQTTIEGDSTHVTGFHMSWTFDAMTSFYMLEGQQLTDENREQVLSTITTALMDNLVLEHYFTYFYDGETPIPYLGSLEGVLTQQKTQLKLDFYIPLGVPKKVTSAPLKLQVYEASYYVDMSWGERSDVRLSPQLAEYCTLQLIEPNPSSQQLSYAMSLAEDESPDHALGSVFSQSIILQCTPTGESTEETVSEK